MLATATLFTMTVALGAQDVRLPMKPGSLKFAVLGDTGTGNSDQARVATQLTGFRSRFPFEFVLLLGDNMYGSERPADYVRKFEQPYKSLLDAGVKFYAVLGNHDDPNQRLYKLFNMNGERYYTFRPSLTGGVRFFMLDSNYMDPNQLQWLEKELAASGSDWKIALFHHPLYASGMHGSDEVLRSQLEPRFLRYGVNVVLTGHEHFYERIKPQKGIQYFVQGSSAKLRRGDISQTGLTAVGYDQGYTFMLIEIDGDTLHFQTINQTGMTVDSGTVFKAVNSNSVIGTSGTRGRGTSGTAPVQPAPAGRGR
jgi:predicted phosphodiesterase